VFGRWANRSDDEVVEALEALLGGSYAEYLERRYHRVPAWAWTNLLAHGTEEELRHAARSRHRTFWDVNVWRHARSYLAGEVLDAADQAGSLCSVQTAVLVPLELELISWVPAQRCCAGEWATRVLAALEDRGHVVPIR
jgi:hypothetical protein